MTSLLFTNDSSQLFTNDSGRLFTNDQPIVYQRLPPIVYPMSTWPIVYESAVRLLLSSQLLTALPRILGLYRTALKLVATVTLQVSNKSEKPLWSRTRLLGT